MTASPPQIFNRKLARLRRERSGALFAGHDFLHRRAMDDIVDRLETVKRDFPRALFIGAGSLTGLLTPACGVGDVFQADSAHSRLAGTPPGFLCEEEAFPVAPASLDLIVSILTLHGANDLVGALAQMRAALKPDGLFIAAVFGEETLSGLRDAFRRAETEIRGGLAPRFAPFAAIQDFGQALSRAGFALPVTDVDRVTVDYANPFSLLKDLRGMGETNVLTSKAPILRRSVLARAADLFGEAGGRERFEIVYLTGWAPHESQQKPLKPGSATASLADAVRNKIS